jgi:hypothetical protein
MSKWNNVCRNVNKINLKIQSCNVFSQYVLPAPPSWRSGAPGCPSLRTTVTIVTRTRTYLYSPGLNSFVDSPSYICLFLGLIPVSALMSLCFPCPDAVRVLFHVHYLLNITPCSLSLHIKFE